MANFDLLNNFGNLSSAPIHVSDSLASTSRLTNYLPASLSLDILVNKPRQASVSYIQSRPSTSFVPASISSQYPQTQAFSQPAYTSTHVRQPVDNQFISTPPLGQTSTYVPGFSNFRYDNMFLPRPEFSKYSGNSFEFKAFINNFESHIEPRVQDQKCFSIFLLSTVLTQCDREYNTLLLKEINAITLLSKDFTKNTVHLG